MNTDAIAAALRQAAINAYEGDVREVSIERDLAQALLLERDQLRQKLALLEQHQIAPLPTTGDQAELITFVEWVRVSSGRAASRLLCGDQDAATAALAEIGQRAADLLNQGRMAEEQDSIEDLDLSKMPPPSFNADPE